MSNLTYFFINILRQTTKKLDIIAYFKPAKNKWIVEVAYVIGKDNSFNSGFKLLGGNASSIIAH